jgi:hypothetical protein
MFSSTMKEHAGLDGKSAVSEVDEAVGAVGGAREYGSGVDAILKMHGAPSLST